MTGLFVLAVLLVAAVCATAALLATAWVTTRPAVFLAAGIAVFLIVVYLGMRLAAARRVTATRRRTARRMLFGITSAVAVLAFVLTAVLPPAPPPRHTHVPGASPVRVSTGSRLAVLKLPARHGPHRTPIVVLHGGPGVPDLASNARVFAPLTDQGFDVYLYAQLGSGDSTRLADPAGYGRDRDTADLEALRRRLGLARFTLVGHSYGGGLAAQYLAAHPDRVTALVLISPAPLDPADHSGDRAGARLSLRQRLGLYAHLLAPRALLGYGLLQVNPAAAHAYLPDREADARNDAVVMRVSPDLHCPGAAPPAPVHGSGFYAMQYPQSAAASPPHDPRAQLSGLHTPTLIIKGSCDYLSWHSATDYRDRLPRSHLVYLPGAGHNAQQDEPRLVHTEIAAFLRGDRLPVRPYGSDAPPSGYQGPP